MYLVMIPGLAPSGDYGDGFEGGRGFSPWDEHKSSGWEWEPFMAGHLSARGVTGHGTGLETREGFHGHSIYVSMGQL